MSVASNLARMRQEEILAAQKAQEAREASSQAVGARVILDPSNPPARAAGSEDHTPAFVSFSSVNAPSLVSFTHVNSAPASVSFARLPHNPERAEELDEMLGFFLKGNSGGVNTIDPKKDGADDAREARGKVLVQFEEQVGAFFYKKLVEDDFALAKDLGLDLDSPYPFSMKDNFDQYNMKTGVISLIFIDSQGQVRHLDFRATDDEIPALGDLGAYINDHTTCPSEMIAGFSLGNKGSYTASRSIVEMPGLQTERIRERVKINDWADFHQLFDDLGVPEDERAEIIRKIRDVESLQTEMVQRMDQVISQRDSQLQALKNQDRRSRLQDNEIRDRELDLKHARELREKLVNIDKFQVCFRLAKPVYKAGEPLNSRAALKRAEENYNTLCEYIGSKVGNPHEAGRTQIPWIRGLSRRYLGDKSLRSSELAYARAAVSGAIQNPLDCQEFNHGATFQDTMEDVLVSGMHFMEHEAYFPHENNMVGVRPDFGLRREFGPMSAQLRDDIFGTFAHIPAFQLRPAGSDGVSMVGIRDWEKALPVPVNNPNPPPPLHAYRPPPHAGPPGPAAGELVEMPEIGGGMDEDLDGGMDVEMSDGLEDAVARHARLRNPQAGLEDDMELELVDLPHNEAGGVEEQV